VRSNPMTKVESRVTYPEPLTWPVAEQLRYVRGFADGEGGPRLYYHKARHSTTKYPNIRMVVISNTDLPLLNTVRVILHKANIESTIYLDHRERKGEVRRDSCVLVILRGQSLEEYQRLVDFTNPAKADTMRKIVSSYKRYAKTVKSPSEAWPSSAGHSAWVRPGLVPTPDSKEGEKSNRASSGC
jgi:LAGLIDADG DNA endonuclease family protein